MMSLKRLQQIIIICSLAAMTLQCGGTETLSSNVTLSVNPDRPAILLGDITINAGTDDEETLSGPLTGFSVTVTNNNEDDDLYIVSAYATTSYTKNGKTSEQEHTWDFDGSSFFVAKGGGEEIVGVFYASGLPDPEEGAADSYNYRIKFYLEGWFGGNSITDITANFRNNVTFTTKIEF